MLVASCAVGALLTLLPLPVSKQFIYLGSDAATISLRESSTRANITGSRLPIGYVESASCQYNLPVGVIATDVFGAESESVTREVCVGLPSTTDGAIDVAQNLMSEVNDLLALSDNGTLVLSESQVAEATALLQAGAIVLESIFASLAEGHNDDETGGTSQAERTAAVRSEYLDLATTVSGQVASASAVESVASLSLTLSSTMEPVLSTSDQLSVLSLVGTLANASGSLGSLEDDTTNSLVGSVSNVVSVGVLGSTNDSSVTDLIMGSLQTVNSVISADMVVGEEQNDVVSDKLAMTSLVIDGFGYASTSFATSVASDGKSSRAPSFDLPAGLLSDAGYQDSVDNSGAAVMSVNWASDPYASQTASSTQNGTSGSGRGFLSFVHVLKYVPIPIFHPILTSH